MKNTMDAIIRPQFAITSVYVYAILVLIGIAFGNNNVSGRKLLEIKKHWGYLIACDHITYIHGVSVTKCAQKCLNHMDCRSINYNVHHKYCELCANEETNGTIRRSGGVYVRRNEIEQVQIGNLVEPLTSASQLEENPKPDLERTHSVDMKSWVIEAISPECNCTSRETCTRSWNTTQCEIEECGPPPMTGNRTQVFGNRQQIGSKVKYTCEVPVTLYSYNHAISVCQEAGEWTVPDKTCGEPVYEGCFKDYPTRVLNSTLGLIVQTMTHEICETHCIDNFHQYFGVENANACFCGDSLPAPLPVDDAQCNLNCPGDISQNCGGVWFLAIYKTII